MHHVQSYLECQQIYQVFNPNPVTLKKLVILLPGAFFGTFIINQFTWSLFWQFWYLIMHWFKFKKLAILLPGAFFGTFKKMEFFTKNHSLYRKNESQNFPEFLVDDFNPKKNKRNSQRQKRLQVTGLGLKQNLSCIIFPRVCKMFPA